MGPGLEVSRRHLFQDRLIQREVRHELLQACVLLLEVLQALRLIRTKAALLALPAIVRLLRDAEPPTRIGNRGALARLDLDRPQMPNVFPAAYRFFAMPPPSPSPAKTNSSSGLFYRGLTAAIRHPPYCKVGLNQEESMT